MAQAKRCCIYIHNTIFLNLSFRGESGSDLQADSFFFSFSPCWALQKSMSFDFFFFLRWSC